MEISLKTTFEEKIIEVYPDSLTLEPDGVIEAYFDGDTVFSPMFNFYEIEEIHSIDIKSSH